MHYPQIGEGEKRDRIKQKSTTKAGKRMDREAQLPDARLYSRLERLVEQLSKAPEQSIPQACGSVHETKAAYRFLG